MGKILSFPDGQTRRWAQVEASVRSALASSGADRGCVDYVCERLRQSFDELDRDLEIQVPESAAELVGKLNAFHHDNCARLLMRLALAYVECYLGSTSIAEC